MQFQQTYIPDYTYCIICGVKSKKETCGSAHSQKLSKIRFTIEERKEEEKAGAKGWDMVSIRKFRTIQDTIG